MAQVSDRRENWCRQVGSAEQSSPLFHILMAKMMVKKWQIPRLVLSFFLVAGSKRPESTKQECPHLDVRDAVPPQVGDPKQAHKLPLSIQRRPDSILVSILLDNETCSISSQALADHHFRRSWRPTPDQPILLSPNDFHTPRDLLSETSIQYICCILRRHFSVPSRACSNSQEELCSNQPACVSFHSIVPE